MSEQELNDNARKQPWYRQLLFPEIFRSFRMATQPGKLLLALVGVIAIFICGTALDMIPGTGHVLLFESPDGQVISEIDAYALTAPTLANSNLNTWRQTIRDQNLDRLYDLTRNQNLGLSFKRDEMGNAAVTKEIRQAYREDLDDLFDSLQEHYQKRAHAINNAEQNDIAKEQALAKLDQAHQALTDALLTGHAGHAQTTGLLAYFAGQKTADQPAAVPTFQENIRKKIALAQALRLANLSQGAGIFATLAQFKFAKMHLAVTSLVSLDVKAAAGHMQQLVMAYCWLSRTHPFYAVVLVLISLAVWALFGGALCRMAALQATRDERIGPWRALQFSAKRFASFFGAPLIPVGIILLISLLIFVGGLLGAVPVVGEIIAGLLTGLALFGGFVVALVTIGLLAGYNLMYPTIAVEGSDSFDAISRAFSYIYGRPWRMGFYSFVAAIYGGICYLFVRLFVFLILASVHWACGSMNVDASSMATTRGKLDAIWPAPQWMDLQPDVQWMSLYWSEKIGAFFIWIWVALAAAMVLAFVLSFAYSANTIIYTLLRKKVDQTDLEDIYVEDDIEEIVADEATLHEAAAEPQQPSQEPPTSPAQEKPDEAQTPADADEPAKQDEQQDDQDTEPEPKPE